MIVTAPSQEHSKSGPRPINLNTDIPQVLKLLEVVFGNSMDFESQRMLSSSARASQQPSFLWRLSPAASKLALGFVWEENGRIVGNVTVLATKTRGRYLVVNVAVHPEYRRRGVARILMEQAATMIRGRQGNQIMLQVEKDNTAARELYNTLRYQTIGSMTSWYAPISRLREISPGRPAQTLPRIRELRGNEWRGAFQLDQASLHPDLNWPELLPPEIYKINFWQRVTSFLSGRHSETWVTENEDHQLTGMINILSEWGRTHYALVRVHPAWQGQLERPLLAKMIRRLRQMSRRNVRIDHPYADEVMNELLQAANLTPRRTLTHMRLDLV